MESFTVDPQNNMTPLQTMVNIISFYRGPSIPKNTRWMTFSGIPEDFKEVLKVAKRNGLNPKRFALERGRIQYDTNGYISDGDGWRAYFYSCLRQFILNNDPKLRHIDRLCEMKIFIGDIYGSDWVEGLTQAGKLIKEKFCNDF